MKEFLFLAVVLVSNVFQAITGFAGTVLAMPVAIRLIGADQAKFVLNIVAWISGIMIAASGYRDIQWKELGKAFAFMAIGMVAGIQIYDGIDVPSPLRKGADVVNGICLDKTTRGVGRRPSHGRPVAFPFARSNKFLAFERPLNARQRHNHATLG